MNSDSGSGFGSGQGTAELSPRVFLPKDVLHGTWEVLIKWGFRPTGAEDETLREVYLPGGWSLAPQVEGKDKRVLMDARKRHRATYYTDSGQLILRQRYDVIYRNAPTQFAFRKMHWYEVVDAGQVVLYKTDDVTDPSFEATHHGRTVFEDTRRELVKTARDWLDLYYPLWQDPTRYWD